MESTSSALAIAGVASSCCWAWLKRREALAKKHGKFAIVLHRKGLKTTLAGWLKRYCTSKRVKFLDLEAEVREKYQLERDDNLFAVRAKEYLKEMKKLLKKQKIVVLVSSSELAEFLGIQKKRTLSLAPTEPLFSEIMGRRLALSEAQREEVLNSRIEALVDKLDTVLFDSVQHALEHIRDRFEIPLQKPSRTESFATPVVPESSGK